VHIFYLLQTRVINFVQKDIGEMFPKWEFDVEDTPAENIIKLMLVKKPWKWTMDCWEVIGTWVNTKPAVVSPAKKKVVKEDSPRPRKKARKEASEEAAAVASEEAAAEASEEVHTTVGGLTKEDIKTMFKDIVDGMREGFGTCLKEIKYLSERVEAVEKKVDASSSKDKAPKPSLVLLDKNQSTVSDLQKEDARYLEKRDAALALCRVNSDRTKKLATSQQSPYTANSTAKVIISNKKLYRGYNPFAPIDKKNHYRTPLDKKPQTSRTWWYQILRTSLEWLEDCRMCLLDHLFSQQWRFNYKDFKDSEPDQNCLGRRLPGGAWNYYACTTPSFCQSNKVWGTDIDDVYAPVNYNDTHWIVMWISIPKRHIVPFTYERPTNIPPVRAGDCGVYTLKYIECHALGIEFSKKDFAKANGKTMRDKMAVDIFQELPDAHEFKNKDNDAILGAYDG
ncbi:unnamed protein product, partial [Brassica oleracea]